MMKKREMNLTIILKMEGKPNTPFNGVKSPFKRA